MSTVQGNLKKKSTGDYVAPNTTTAAVYDAAREQALSATLVDLPDKSALGYPSFSTAADYSAGDVVYYENKLWRFTSDHPHGGWSESDVEEYSIKDILDAALEEGALSSVLSEAFASLNERIASLEAALRDPRQRIDLTVENLDATDIRRLGTPLILECSVAGAPSAANQPDNWEPEAMGTWAGYPVFVGQIYIDKMNKKTYIAYTVTASTANWVALN